MSPLRQLDGWIGLAERHRDALVLHPSRARRCDPSRGRRPRRSTSSLTTPIPTPASGGSVARGGRSGDQRHFGVRGSGRGAAECVAGACRELEVTRDRRSRSRASSATRCSPSRPGRGRVQGRREHLRTLGPGDVFGEIAGALRRRAHRHRRRTSPMKLVMLFNGELARLDREVAAGRRRPPVDASPTGSASPERSRGGFVLPGRQLLLDLLDGDGRRLGVLPGLAPRLLDPLVAVLARPAAPACRRAGRSPPRTWARTPSRRGSVPSCRRSPRPSGRRAMDGLLSLPSVTSTSVPRRAGGRASRSASRRSP